MEADLLELDAVPVWDVYDRMKKARKKAKIRSTADMARRLAPHLGFTPDAGTVGAWERGTNQPTRMVRWDAVIEAWALATHVPLLWLAHGEGTQSRCFSESAQVSAVPPLLGQVALFDLDSPSSPFVPVLVSSDA